MKKENKIISKKKNEGEGIAQRGPLSRLIVTCLRFWSELHGNDERLETLQILSVSYTKKNNEKKFEIYTTFHHCRRKNHHQNDPGFKIVPFYGLILHGFLFLDNNGLFKPIMTALFSSFLFVLP